MMVVPSAVAVERPPSATMKKAVDALEVPTLVSLTVQNSVGVVVVRRPQVHSCV